MARYTDRLTDKQAAFVREYVADHNATQAAIRAGYSQSTAYSIGWENLRKPEIAEAITEYESALADEIGITKQWILERLREVAERCLQATEVTDREGNPTGEWTFQATGANKALELLGKHRGMFIERATIDHSGRIDITINGIDPTDLT